MKEAALRAKDVAERARVGNAKAIQLMQRLGAVNVARPGAKKRDLRLPAEKLDAFLNGKITLAEPNVCPMPARATKTKRAPEGPPARIIAYRTRKA